MHSDVEFKRFESGVATGAWRPGVRFVEFSVLPAYIAIRMTEKWYGAREAVFAAALVALCIAAGLAGIALYKTVGPKKGRGGVIVRDRGLTIKKWFSSKSSRWPQLDEIEVFRNPEHEVIMLKLTMEDGTPYSIRELGDMAGLHREIMAHLPEDAKVTESEVDSLDVFDRPYIRLRRFFLAMAIVLCELLIYNS